MEEPSVLEKAANLFLLHGLFVLGHDKDLLDATGKLHLCMLRIQIVSAKC